ncbi:B12-binding domain-containing radical SAM protein [Halobacteriovorax sp. HLS]|uniref:B12-binding domain-containing radical SAM protein n=1 Tax=Halobacteriovorax sp. HLS TaxID=2234000 RepID=UPI000FDAC497|nr:radical SAM protein [Halobacteriovorax sp. HLS]
MHVTFIRPSMTDHNAKDALEPLAIAMLASYSPEGTEHSFYDNRIEPIPYDTPTDLVAITVETYTARRAYQIALEYKKRGVPIVMGGYHVTFLPDEALQYCDSVVIGDAEETWPQLISDAKNGRLKERYITTNTKPLCGIRPDRTIFKGKKYGPIHMVQYGRGCRYNCDFCSIKTFYKDYLGQRPVHDVIAEIEKLKYKQLFIVDDNIFSYKKQAIEFFKALIPLNIRWSGQVSIDVTNDPELMKLMRDSGCMSVVVGFESLDIQSLNKMRKGWNLRYGGYEKAIKTFRDHGIMIYGTFVHGYDTDTLDTFKTNLEFSIENKFFLANFNPLTPTPGAALYNRLKNEGRLINDPWWLDPEYQYGHAHFHPKNYTAKELTDGCYWARTEFNKYSNIFKRAVDIKSNFSSIYHAGTFLAANIVTRHEIRKKHGSYLSDRNSPLIINSQTMGEL